MSGKVPLQMQVGKESVVVITGASLGIGRAAALEFGRRGATVVVAARNEPLLQEVAREITSAGGKGKAIRCDVAIESDCKNLIDATVEAFGHIDILVNNAGRGHYAGIDRLSTGDLDAIFRTNLYGTLWCTQAALPHMKPSKRGHIVNISTVISRRSIPYMTAYCMTKFAMNAFDEGLRLEVRPYGIDVSLVCPGLTATEFQNNSTRAGSSPPMLNQGGMSAAKVGRAIVSAVEHRKRRVMLTWNGKVLNAVQKVSPSLCDELVYHLFARRMRKAATV